MSTILRTQNESGTKYDLDLFNEAEFLLDISAIESGDIGKVFGISSQTFALPPTKTNDEYFGNLYDLGSSGEVAFTKTQPCQVINDGQAIFAGRLYLQSVVTNTRGDTIYNVVVTNETVDFKYAIEDLTFGDLDWSEYDHNLTYANVSASWGNNLFNGEIVYPLVEYGSKDKDTQSSLLQSGGSPNTFTNVDSPLRLDQFKPAVRLRTVMDKILETAGYSYTSSLFEDSYMDSVYVLATKDSEQGATTLNPISQSFQAAKVAPVQDQAFSGSLNPSPFIVTFPTEVLDNANRFSNPTFTAAEDGSYSFNGKLALFFSTGSGNSPGNATIKQLQLDLFINGTKLNQPHYFNLSSNYDGQTISLPYNFPNVVLSDSDDVDLRATFGSRGSEVLAFLGGINGSVNTTFFQMYKGPETLIGGNVNIGGSFMPEDGVLDFINGVIQKFNLVIEPLNENQKTLQIETFNDWIDKGATDDWTDKVDRSVKWEIRHPLQGQPRNVYFSDIEDTDSANQYSITQLDKIYGDKLYQGESDLAEGERRIGTYFAPTPMKFIEGTTDFIVPRIYELNEGFKTQFSFKPRLLHYVEYKDVDDLRGRSGSLNTSNEWYLQDESAVVQTQTAYPVFHHNENLPANRQTTRDLHFGNNNHWSYHQSTGNNAFTKRDAVYEYWSFYLNGLYDIDARLLTCNVYLRPDEIGDIALNTRYFIDGHYYRINKISGANLTKPQSTKVELIKELPRKSRFPRRRVFDPIDPTDDFDDIYTGDDDVFDGGGVRYRYWDTDEPYTGSIIQAANKDGWNSYSGSFEGMWTTNRTSIPSNNRVVGANYIDERVHSTDVVGSGNNILGNIQNSSIIGNNNTIQESGQDIHIFGNNVTIGQESGSGQVLDAYVISPGSESIQITSGSGIIALNPVYPITELDSNRTIIGNAVLQGAQYETYTNVEVGDGTTTYLTGSAGIENFHHHFQYTSSVNGTAVVFIEDNTDPTLDGVKMRFTTDGNLTASKQVFLTPYPSGSIDGQPEKALTTPYDGLTLQIINGEWLVIQEKAK